MAIDFPSSPTAGQSYVFNGVTYTYTTQGMWVQSGAGNATLGVAIRKFVGSGTYLPSGGLQFAIVECIGGGGGGGLALGVSGKWYLAGGGGAGGYSRSCLTAAQIGGSQSVTIGGGGVGQISGVPGTAGGVTSFGGLCVANGGQAGTHSQAGVQTGFGGAGGVAGAGDIASAGAPGGGGAVTSDANTIVTRLGYGGSSTWGGGALAPTTNSNGIAASNYGSGGSGALDASGATFNGGAGSAGICIITEYISLAVAGGSTLSYAAPFDALAFNGIQVNGSMEVSQELQGAGTSTSGKYIIDSWQLFFAGTMTISGTGGPLVYVPGIGGLLYLNVGTLQAVLSNNQYVCTVSRIEGWRTERLGWGNGSAYAQPLTISFWSSHQIPGVYTGSIRNGASTRSYAFTYTHASVGGLQYQTITIPGCPDGVWSTDNSIGMQITFMMAGLPSDTANFAPIANVWLNANYLGGPGQINGVASANVFRLTGLTVLPGTQAPTAAQSPNAMRSFGDELALCQRYYEPLYGGNGTNVFYSSVFAGVSTIHKWPFKVHKRVVPTVGLAPNVAWSAGVVPDITGVSIDGVTFYHGSANFFAARTPQVAGTLSAYADARM